MPANSNESIENRVLETSNRLRLIQVDFADESEQTRTEYLCEELERALKKVLPEQRNEFLEKLRTRFPAWNIDAQPILHKIETQGDTQTMADELKNPDLLIRRLLEIAPTLSSDQKQLISKAFHQEGSGPDFQQYYSADSVQKLKDQLQLGDDAALDTYRFTEMIVLLADFVCKLDPLVWNTWRKLSPRSSIRSPGSLVKTMGLFLNRDSELDESRKQLDNELKELQRLIAAVITSISRVGGQFATHHLAKFSPSEISALVKMERSNVFVSQEVKCWRKYLELVETLTEDSIETDIRKTIVDYVESLVKGIGRKC